jgi:hypothetical protein
MLLRITQGCWKPKGKIASGADCRSFDLLWVLQLLFDEGIHRLVVVAREMPMFLLRRLIPTLTLLKGG